MGLNIGYLLLLHRRLYSHRSFCSGAFDELHRLLFSFNGTRCGPAHCKYHIVKCWSGKVRGWSGKMCAYSLCRGSITLSVFAHLFHCEKYSDLLVTAEDEKLAIHKFSASTRETSGARSQERSWLVFSTFMKKVSTFTCRTSPVSLKFHSCKKVFHAIAKPRLLYGSYCWWDDFSRDGVGWCDVRM